jgi:hypothetical protein
MAAGMPLRMGMIPTLLAVMTTITPTRSPRTTHTVTAMLRTAMLMGMMTTVITAARHTSRHGS